MDDQLLPGASAGYSLGAVASVFPDERSGLTFIEENRTTIESLNLGEPHTIAVRDPWQLMRRAAGEGFSGIAGVSDDASPENFMFMTRVEEAGSALPTVLTSIAEDTWGPSLTRVSEQHLPHSDLLHWERFDILDRLSARWGKRCPFRDWDHGQLLYEIRSKSLVVSLAHVPLLGDWNSTEGAFAFFTDREDAHHYLDHHLGDGQNRMTATGDAAPSDPHKMMASLTVEPVADLQQRLTELRRASPFSAWCINPSPHTHRSSASYGRLAYGGEHLAGFRATESGPNSLMIAVSGHWYIQPENVFQMKESDTSWTGLDTIQWSRGQSIQLAPLNRSFRFTSPINGINPEDLEDADAQALVDQVFDSYEYRDINEAFEILSLLSEGTENRLEQFHLVTWDAVTGDGADWPWRFPNFLEALGFLANYERRHDREHRTAGASSCSLIGIAGSGNEAHEDTRSRRFQEGCRKIALKSIRNGYKPSDAEHLVSLCNNVLATLHVNFGGYPKDLLWASPPEKVSDVCDKLGIEEVSFIDWAKSEEATVDSRGKQLALKRMHERAWDSLSPKTRHFLATALQQFEDQGRAPQLDYAPISLELVKALEVELVAILEGYRDQLNDALPKYNDQAHEQRSLAEFLRGGKPPTLGPMRYLFRESQKTPTELTQSLFSHARSLEIGDFLTGDEFAKKGLDRVIYKYRNDGVHSLPISWETCTEAVERIVGTLENPGYITRLVGTPEALA